MTIDSASRPTYAALALVAAFAGIYVIWGTTYLAIAFAIQTVPPFITGAARFLIAAVLLYVWLHWRAARGRANAAMGRSPSAALGKEPECCAGQGARVLRAQGCARAAGRKDTQEQPGAGAQERPIGRSPFAGVNIPIGLFCGVLLSGIGNGFVIWAQQGIPSGIAALIIAAVPVVVAMIDWAMFSKRAPSKQAFLGIAVAIGGVAAIILHTRTLAGDAQPLHLLAMIASVVGWSFGTLIQKRAANGDIVLSFTCVQMFGGGLFQLALSFADGEWRHFDIAAVSGASILAIVYLIVFGSLIALNCYLWLLTRVPAQKVTTYALVNPVVALILGALVLGERITPLAATSAALVLVGVALVLFQGAQWGAWRKRLATSGG